MSIKSTLYITIDSALGRWLAVALWMGVIFVLSAQPRLPNIPEPLLDILFKKAAHFSVYAVLAALLWRALPRGRSVWSLTWLLTVLYACSDEIHQAFVLGRHPSPWDVLIDSCGAATALLAVWFIYRSRAENRPEDTQLKAESVVSSPLSVVSHDGQRTRDY